MEEETEVRPERGLQLSFYQKSLNRRVEAACAAFEVEAVAVTLSRDVRAESMT